MKVLQLNPDKFKTAIKSFLMAMITVMSLGFLGEYLPLVEMVLGDLDELFTLGLRIAEMVGAYLIWKPIAATHTGGQIIKTKWRNDGPKSLSSDKEQSYYNYAKAA